MAIQITSSAPLVLSARVAKQGCLSWCFANMVEAEEWLGEKDGWEHHHRGQRRLQLEGVSCTER